MHLAIGFAAIFSSVAALWNMAKADLILDLGASINGTAPSGITAQSFDALSTPDRHAFGTYLAAADVQGIPAGGGTTSGSIGTTTAAVPETSAIAGRSGIPGGADLLLPARTSRACVTNSPSGYPMWS